MAQRISDGERMTSFQQTALIVLRTLVGWHFFYEGYTKLLQPAWSRAGAPVTAWSSAGYLKAATGPLADVFHSLGNASWIGTLDIAVAALLVAVGLSLMLGLFTQAGCIGALGLLALFYLSAIPMGLPETRAEGTYLIVNKNLIEAAAVLVLWSFRTGRIAGMDQYVSRQAAADRQLSAAPRNNHDLTPTREAS
jgi:thiosulfate dehydrogenase (quinone) large subunit